jgi:hypothetical protein
LDYEQALRPWNIDQTLLLPPNVRDFVPKDHVSRFIVGLVRESLDLKAIMGSYVSGLGQPPFDPRMMVSLLLHGYASGLYSSRRIARACCERNDFVMIAAPIRRTSERSAVYVFAGITLTVVFFWLRKRHRVVYGAIEGTGRDIHYVSLSADHPND